MWIIKAPERSFLVALYLLFYAKQSDFEGTRYPFFHWEPPLNILLCDLPLASGNNISSLNKVSHIHTNTFTIPFALLHEPPLKFTNWRGFKQTASVSSSFVSLCREMCLNKYIFCNVTSFTCSQHFEYAMWLETYLFEYITSSTGISYQEEYTAWGSLMYTYSRSRKT